MEIWIRYIHLLSNKWLELLSLRMQMTFIQLFFNQKNENLCFGKSPLLSKRLLKKGNQRRNSSCIK